MIMDLFCPDYLCGEALGLKRSNAIMVKFFLWLLLLVICWPIALIALILYPLVWLLLIPFRLLGFAVQGILEFLKALFLLPARVLGGARQM